MDDWIEITGNMNLENLPERDKCVLLWCGRLQFPPFVGTLSNNDAFYDLEMQCRSVFWWRELPKMPEIFYKMLEDKQQS